MYVVLILDTTYIFIYFWCAWADLNDPTPELKVLYSTD